MSYLILVRHGQSTWNLEKKFTGWVDVDLTENGKLEAKKSGELIKLKNINIDIYYSSFQLRAKNTLKLIKEIPTNKIPDTESLKDTYERVLEFYKNDIETKISENNILISAHGNSIRALCKYLFKFDFHLI